MVSNWLKQFGLALWGIICFIGGLFVYAKFLDKPETVVNNEYGKIKNKGTNNDVSTSNSTQVSNEENNVKKKRKFRLFGKKK